MLPSQRHESDGKSECTDAQHQVLARCLREDARAAIHCPFSLPRSKHGRAAIYCSCAPSRCEQRRTAAERQSFCSSKFANRRRAQRCYLRKCIAPRSGIVLEKTLRAGISSVPWMNVRDQAWLHKNKVKRQQAITAHLTVAPDLFTKTQTPRTGSVTKGDTLNFVMPEAPRLDALFPFVHQHRGKGSPSYSIRSM